jgi:solute carrier family 6 GABA transporter-like protein 1
MVYPSQFIDFHLLYLLSQGGAYIFQLMDFYSASGMSLLWVCFFQTIAISWIFGAKKFTDCVEQMMGIRPNNFWYICWVFCAPAVMLVSSCYTQNNPMQE